MPRSREQIEDEATKRRLDVVEGQIENYPAGTVDQVTRHLARLSRDRCSGNLTPAGVRKMNADIELLLDRLAYLIAVRDTP